MLGLLAVFTIDIRNIGWAYSSVVRFFSGSEIPLWLLPQGLAQAAALLPFRCMFAIPLSIYIGQTPAAQAGPGLALQLGWFAALTLLGRLVWRGAHRRLTVQGG